MEIKLFGAAKTVTGSCYHISTKTDKILIDCGMFQGGKKLEKLNYDDFGFDTKHVKALLLTHAHLDHCGRIPKLVKNGFKGKIYATSATKELAYVVMMDSANIAMHDISYENEKRKKKGLPLREPIYTKEDVLNSIKLFKTVDYNKLVKITSNINAKFYNSGHILGASSIQLGISENNKTTTIVFSGDIGQIDTPIVKDPQLINNADYVFIESTYGDRLHSPIKETKQKFLQVISETYKKNGKLMIPSFAIERSQELLFYLNGFAEKNIMPKVNVYLDSPMAIKATEIFKKQSSCYECYDKETRCLIESGDNPFSFPGLIYSNTVDDSKKIKELKEACIIIAGSGMCTAGRIKHHIKNHIDDPKNTILFVGYQVQGTLGYWIKKGESKIRLLGTEKKVMAKVESIDSLSGHADYNGLLNWLRYFNPVPKKVFITHGEEKSTLSFSKKIKNLGIKTQVPGMKENIII